VQAFHFLPVFKFILCKSKSFVALVNAPVEMTTEKAKWRRRFIAYEGKCRDLIT